MPFNYTIALIFAAVISMLAHSFVMRTYAKAKEIPTFAGLTGAQVARQILDDNGLQEVQVVQSQGTGLNDHYDPTKKIVALSHDNYTRASIGAVAIAAHEVGHAIQHATGYKFIAIRNILLKPTIIASQFSQFAILFGLTSQLTGLLDIGIILISIVLAFQVITLPIEFDASARALKIIQAHGYVDSSELVTARKTLTAAALTYVAAVVGTVVNLLFLLSARRRRS